MTDSRVRMAEAVAELCRARQEIAAPEILGVHLEGPFLNPAYKGAHPAEHLRLPLPGLLEQIMEAAGGNLAMITLAPELPGGLEAVAYFARQGVVAAMGHSGAPFDLVRQAVTLGLKHVVHTYSGMAAFHHRRPGPLGASLVLDELSTELVADGIHCHPAAVKLLCRVKKPRQLVLATDASSGAGLPAGEYTLGGAKLDIKNGCSRLADGTLAGSTLTMNRALAGAVEMGGLSLEEAVAAATVNPAAVLGLEARKGALESGKDADVIVMSRAYEVLLTVCKGVVMQNCLEANKVYLAGSIFREESGILFRLIRFVGKLIGGLVLAVLGLLALAVVVVAVRYWIWTPDTMADYYGGRAVLIQGHRGAPEAAPENTLPSFSKALQRGAHGVELDVMLSKDGELVVIHDYELDATTNGSGSVKDYTLAELKQLDAGSWFADEFAGTTIPTLQEVIDHLPVRLLNIEIKVKVSLPTGGAGRGRCHCEE